MIMQMPFVQMRSDDDLEPITPEVLRRLHADLMAELRCDLAGLEALIAMPGDVAIGLVKLLLGQNHLLYGGLSGAVDGGDIGAVCSGCGTLHISCRIPEILQIRDRAGFVRVFGVVDHILQLAGDVPELGGRHQDTSCSGSNVNALCSATMESSSRRASSALPSSWSLSWIL